MSGYHRAYQYVDAAEWARLQRLANSYSRQQSNYQNLLKQAQKSSAKEIERIRKQSDEQQRRFNQEISQLSAESRAAQDQLSRELRQSREQFANQLHQQQAQFANDLIGVSNELHNRITTVSQHFEQQNSAMRKSIQKERQTREKQFNEIDARTSDLEAKAREQERLAQTYFNDAVGLSHAIRQELPHEQYAPGHLDNVDRQLERVRTDLLQSAPSAALAEAYRSCDALTLLRADIEVKEEKRLQMLGVALEWADALANQARAFSSTTLGVTLQNGVLVDAESIDKNQEIETDDLDREHWGGGALSAVANEIVALQSLLRNEDMFLSQAALDKIVEELPVLEQRVNDIDVLAVQNYSLHREKVRIAEIIATQLGADYFEITENSDWAQGNELGDFVIEGVNDLNDKSVVIIGSESGPDEQPRVTIEYFNYRGNEDDPEDARAERVRQSVEVLSQQGVKITSGGQNGTEVAPEPDPAFKDVERLRKEGVKAVSAKQRATAH